ncbi:MAG: DNA pilot protein [Microvirus sp.]|nr:MAG: DNA pilot protein [Microvirus sp.]
MPLLETISTLGALATSPFNYAAQNAQLNKQRAWAVEDRDYQNKYNTPRAQVARNRAAGLPLAALFSGAGAGGQSDQPRGTTIQPELRSERSIEGFNQTRMNNAQLELVRENTRQARAEADIAEAERDSKLRPWANEADTGFLNSKNIMQGYTNLEKDLQTKRMLDIAKANEASFDQMYRKDQYEIQHKLKQKDIQIDFFEAQKNKVLKEIEGLGLDITNRQEMRDWTQKKWEAINSMDEGPTKFISGMLMKLFEGMVSKAPDKF